MINPQKYSLLIRKGTHYHQYTKKLDPKKPTSVRHRDELILSKPKTGCKGCVIIKFIIPPPWYIRELWGLVRILLFGTVVCLGLAGFAIWTVRNVKITPLPSVPTPLAIFASNGKTQISGGVSTPHQEINNLKDVPELLINTLLLSEDQYYHYHPGVNPVSIGNALRANYSSGETLSGASTITMQLARTLFLDEVNQKDLWGNDLRQQEIDNTDNADILNLDTEENNTDDSNSPKMTLTRKIREAGLALRLTNYYGRDRLLLAYLNSVDLGYRKLTQQQLRGVADASLFYFNQPVSDLVVQKSPEEEAINVANVARIANLVALIKAPATAYGVCETRLESDVVNERLQAAEENNEPLTEPDRESYINPVALARDDVVFLMRVRNRLIQGMQSNNWISEEISQQAQDSSNFPLFRNREGFCERQVKSDDRFDDAPFFANQSIREELQQVLPQFEDPYENLIVETSLDIEKQKIAAQLLNQYGERLQREQGVPHGALITIDSSTGQIQALVGEASFPDQEQEDQIWLSDYAANEPLPPGSTFKMFFYVDALKEGMPLTQTFACDNLAMEEEIFTIAEYSKVCGSGVSSVDLETAVAQSDNLVPLQAVSQYSNLESVIETAKNMGINSPLDPTPRLAFGYSRVNLREITAAYAVLANEGRYNRPHFIKTVYKNTNTGNCNSSPENFRNCPILYQDTEVRTNQFALPESVAKGAFYGWGGRQFLTHFNGFSILARNLFAGGFGCKLLC